MRGQNQLAPPVAPWPPWRLWLLCGPSEESHVACRRPVWARPFEDTQLCLTWCRWPCPVPGGQRGASPLTGLHLQPLPPALEVPETLLASSSCLGCGADLLGAVTLGLQSPGGLIRAGLLGVRLGPRCLRVSHHPCAVAHGGSVAVPDCPWGICSPRKEPFPGNSVGNSQS